MQYGVPWYWLVHAARIHGGSLVEGEEEEKNLNAGEEVKDEEAAGGGTMA